MTEQIMTENSTHPVEGTVFNIQHFSIHDGPGIRTVVFLKGCPLRCKWCANPESQSFKTELAWLSGECIRCNECRKLKDLNCHFEDDVLNWNSEKSIDESTSEIDAKIVNRICPTQALHVIGEKKSMIDVMNEVEKDSEFFSQSGGGMTVSGGEPLSQSEFLYALLKEAGKRKIHRAMETTLFAPYEKVHKIVSELDYLLTDIKAIDEEIHIKNTGVSNKLILENIKKVRRDFPKLPIKIRTPVIPNVNDTENEIAKISLFVKNLGVNTEYELLKYHRYGLSKYASLHRIYEMGDAELSDEKFKYLNEVREKILWKQINTIAYDGSHI